MQLFRVNDASGRQVEFNGVLLGSGTTRETNSLRWTETRLWRTQGGSYILQKAGRSVVFHSADACNYGVKGMQFELTNEHLPCPVCKPQRSSHGVVKIETDRYYVHISDTADGIVESARMQDEDGVWYIPKVSQVALEKAAVIDEKIRDAFMVTKVE